jgi:hypothetical protein
VNRDSLQELLAAEGVDPAAYSLDGDAKDETLCLEVSADGWTVHYSERGLRTGEQRFDTEADACDALARVLLADPSNRSRD